MEVWKYRRAKNALECRCQQQINCLAERNSTWIVSASANNNNEFSSVDGAHEMRPLLLLITNTLHSIELAQVFFFSFSAKRYKAQMD